MSDIFKRIGEAIASQGKITIVAALDEVEDKVLQGAQFKKVGTMDLNGSVLNLYEVKIQQIINTQDKWHRHMDKSDKPDRYTQNWPENYRMYSNGSGNSDLITKHSTTSLMDNAYQPLSMLEDYFFPTKTTFTIEVDDNITHEDSLRFVESIKEEFLKTGRRN